MSAITRIAALLTAQSTYERGGPTLGSLPLATVDKLREQTNGQLAPLPHTPTRWYLRDLESAQAGADNGRLAKAAQLWRACRSDGVFAGVLSTRTDGLVRLPKTFKGGKEIVDALQVGNDSIRSVFDEMFPPAELALMAADGIGLGISVGELLPVPGRDYPVLVRLDPEFLHYKWSENRWFYRTIFGEVVVTPGDGRWVLHTPGGRLHPWNSGIWRAIGRAWIHKEHALLFDSNWQSKLANPARVAVAPQGAAEAQKQSWWRAVLAWGTNTVFGVTPGYDVKLLESNGRGSEAFDRTVQRSEREMIVATAGQEVTVDGGTGFQNSDVHKSIRADLIKGTADALAYTLNTQGIPPWVIERFGEEAIAESAIVEWDVTPPKDRASEAASMQAIGTAISMIDGALARHGLEIDADKLTEKFAIPVRKMNASNATDKLSLKPEDAAKVVTVDEARDGQGLDPVGDERGDMTIVELENETEAGDESTEETEAA